MLFCVKHLPNDSVAERRSWQGNNQQNQRHMTLADRAADFYVAVELDPPVASQIKTEQIEVLEPIFHNTLKSQTTRSHTHTHTHSMCIALHAEVGRVGKK